MQKKMVNLRTHPTGYAETVIRFLVGVHCRSTSTDGESNHCERLLWITKSRMTWRRRRRESRETRVWMIIIESCWWWWQWLESIDRLRYTHLLFSEQRSAAQGTTPHHTIERFNFPLEKQKTRQREDITRRAASASLVRVWNVIHRRCRGAK